jgi:hypothetical protein
MELNNSNIGYTPKTKDGFFFEQSSYSNGPILIDDIWLDSDKIPTQVPDLSEFKNNLYTININNRSLDILEYCENIELNPISEYVYQNDKLKGIILPWFNKACYSVVLKDNKQNNISLGWAKAKFDPIGGTITFNEKLDNFDKTKVFATFYRYNGRISFNKVLDTSGLTPMDENYNPLNKKDVATKDYVDQNIESLQKLTNSLLPPTPETFENKTLNVLESSGEYPYVLTNIKYNVLSKKDKLKISIPNSYLPETGKLSLVIDDNEICSIDLKDITEKTYDLIKITSIKDSHLSYNWIPLNYYKTFEGEIEINYSDLSKYNFETLNKPIYNLKLVYSNEATKYSSNSFSFGVEYDLMYTRTTMSLESAKDFKVKYISGVPSLLDDEVLTFKIHIGAMVNFKGNNYIAKFIIDGVNYLIPYEETYPNIEPYHEFILTKTIDKNINFENINFYYEIYNYKGEILESETKIINLRHDSCNESERFSSGSGYIPTEFGKTFNSESSIETTEDLQKYRGNYVWPQDDFSKFGTEMEWFGNYLNIKYPKIAPNFKNIISKDFRWVVFKTYTSLTHGLVITIDNPTELYSNNLTKVPENFIVQLKVGNTGWLDCKPYILGSLPSKDQDHALVSLFSDNTTKRFTFGSESYEGDVYVRIGIKSKDLKASFSGITVTTL